ncbi:hypothetical protein [Burkholderia sp. 9120]|uniref:hypothetical protein n=1 Tax=Burkholderia sp. 9120 TaxID=1500897 RepID=UPI0012DFECE9|nr:hypothetical protein [Burkholderia sp. 9120]
MKVTIAYLQEPPFGWTGSCYDRAALLKERKQASTSSAVNRNNLYSNHARSSLASLENALKA